MCKGNQRMALDDFLLLNKNKTEAITVIPVNQSAVAKSIQLGDVTIPLSISVTNLGAVFDRKCKIAKHATRICRNANYYLHRATSCPPPPPHLKLVKV